MDVESEIRDLKRRVGEIEGTYGFLSGQVREVHRAVLGFQEQTNDRFDRMDACLGEVDERLDHIDARLERHDEQFEKVARRFDKLEDGVSKLEGGMTRMEAAMQRMDQAVDTLPSALAEIVRAEFARRDHEADG